MAALTSDTILPWLQKNKNLLNIAGIATAAGISPVTLRAYVSGERNMPTKTAEQLLAVLKTEFLEFSGQVVAAKISAADAYKGLAEALRNIPAEVREQLLREDLGLVRGVTNHEG